MVGCFTGIFVGMEKRKGKRGEYYVLRFLDEQGKVFECFTKDFEVASCLEKLEKIDFVADVETRDAYTRITFLGIS